jgi:hypothetical protein
MEAYIKIFSFFFLAPSTQVACFIPCVPIIVTGNTSSCVPVNVVRHEESDAHHDVLTYMLMLAHEMAIELTAQKHIDYVVVDGFHRLTTQEIGGHVYFTQACRAQLNFLALRGAHEDDDDPFVWRMYFGCGTDKQRDDVASLLSTIKDTEARNLVEGGCRELDFVFIILTFWLYLLCVRTETS